MARVLLILLAALVCVGCSAAGEPSPVATDAPAVAVELPAATDTVVAATPSPAATPTSTAAPSATPTPLPTDTATPAPTPTATVDPSILLPDLQTLPPYELRIQIWPEGNRVIRFSNSILNAGPGALKVLGQSDAGSATTRVTQHVYHVDGTFEEHAAGVFAFHTDHDHWHLGNFARYEVWSLTADGELDEVVALTDKVSYCLMDETRSDLPIAAAEPTYTLCDQTIQGISPGWIDTYEYNTPGQIVDITDLPNGVYALRSTADPAGQLRELDGRNNAGMTYFERLGDDLEVMDGPPLP